jgi:nitrogen fixation/metabolism regulation signal transduction histidine kinase
LEGAYQKKAQSRNLIATLFGGLILITVLVEIFTTLYHIYFGDYIVKLKLYILIA